MKGWDYFSKDSFSISVEGVEFCPVDFEIDDENKVNIQPPDIEWAERLPFKWSKGLMSQEEVYFAFRKGLYINDSQQWFSISKKSKKRLMLPARAILQEEKLGLNLHSLRKSWIWKAQPAGSRFKEAAECSAKNRLAIAFQIEGQLLSPETIYACYLVFKLPANDSVFEGIVMTSFETPSSSKEPATIERHIYLLTPPNTPIIDQSYGQIPSRTRKIKGHPKLRKDGWMEIQVWEFVLGSSSNYFWMNGHLKSLNKWKFTGLLVQGIELRPAKVSWNYSNSVLL
ncbi:hypothetical protein L1987_55820 [Smallanthus sonchifolius]|uniref:Uncharacterized protein n=1 Tax=Smallanthus sonchifolius TaxID=185202 RepID=A0ACB9EAF8_9ASTR|nr:hypothetical protein L1987_55820 [Smallanthus sonchifolius]